MINLGAIYRDVRNMPTATPQRTIPSGLGALPQRKDITADVHSLARQTPVSGTATPQMYQRILQACLTDKGIGGLNICIDDEPQGGIPS
jgi:hypothetical protein